MIAAIKRHRKQIVLFFIAGVISAFIEIVLMKVLSLPKVIPSVFPFEKKSGYFLSNLFSTGGGILTNYFLSIYFVFERGKHSKRKEFSLFIMFSFVTMFLSWGLFNAFHSFIKEPIDLYFFKIGDIVFCKMMAIGIISTINYVLKKKIVFSN